MSEKYKIEVHELTTATPLRRRPEPIEAWEAGEKREAADLRDYWRIIRKRRWMILSIFFAVFGLVTTWTLGQKPIYRAEVLLEIQTENPDIRTVQQLFAVDTVSDTYLETQYKVLKSDPLAERTIDQLGLDRMTEFAPSKSWAWVKKRVNPRPETFDVNSAPTERDPAAYQGTLERFQDRLEVMPVRRSQLVAVSFDSQDPALAADIVNTFVSGYIDQSLQAHLEATQKASGWLSRQSLDLKAKLEKSEDELQKYASENGLQFLETDKGNNENIVNERLRQLQGELTKAQAARYEKESLYRLVQAGDFASLPGVFENKLVQDLTMQLADLQRQDAQLTTTFSPTYPKVKEIRNEIKEVEAVRWRERQHAAQRITDDYTAAINREKLVRRDFQEQQKQADLVAQRSVRYNTLKRELESNENLYDSLLQRQREAGVSAGLKASNIRIVAPGRPPIKPVRPKALINLASAAVLGLVLAVGIAFLQNYMDNTVKNPDDVKRFLHLPALAFIPSVGSLNGRRRAASLQFSRGGYLTLSPTSPTNAPATALALRYHRVDLQGLAYSDLAEAFRGLCTSVLHPAAGHPPGSILITSAQPGEGKTTVSTNLAIALAEIGKRVLLIDADMRRPSVHKLFNIQNGFGLVSYLTGEQDWRPVAQPTGIDGLDTLLCKPMPPTPVVFLSSERMRRLIGEALQEYKFVVIDSPSLLNVADSRILANLVEGVILVVKSGATPRVLVKRAESQIRDVGAKVVGVVLNSFDFSDDSYSQNCRRDYYAQDSWPR